MKVDVLASQREKEAEDDDAMECDTTTATTTTTTTIITTQDSDEEMPEVTRNTSTNLAPTSKTVLISRCQTMRESDLPDGTMTLTNGHAASPEEEDECDVPSEPQEVEAERQEEQTPEVRIHPATPEVLAAHQSHGDGPKRSIITLTLRPRNPSESSCEARVISRTPSLASTRSSSSVSSGPLVNGVDGPYQNGTLEDDAHSPVTPEIRITPLKTDGAGSGSVPPVKVSTRCMNSNKTASFVVINTPTASPRAPRPKTPVIAGYNGSPKPYSSSKVTVKTRDPSVESLRSQRPVTSRKENGVSSKVPLTNGKGPSVAPAVNYCSPLKVTTSTTTGPRTHRPERGELRYPREARCEHREERYERREDRYDRYAREDRYEKKDERYEKREERYDIKRDERYEKRDDNRYDKREDNRYTRREDNRCDRDHRYEADKRHFREVRRHDSDSFEKDYDPPQYRPGQCSVDFRELREAWCKREYDFKYEDDQAKCERIFAYERELDHPHHHKLGRDGRYEREGHSRGSGDIIGKGRASYEPRDHYRPKDYPKGLPNTASTPTPTPAVITESSV